MGIFNRKKTKKSITTGEITQFGSDFFYSVGAASTINWKDGQFLKYYLETPEVAAVIQKKAAAFANMKLDVVSKTTGEPVPDTNPIAKIIRKPNYFQGQKEFLFQTKLFHEIFGNEIIYFFRPVGFGFNSIFTLPPNFVELEEPTTPPFFQVSDYPSAVEYYFNFGSYRAYLPKENIVHIKNAPAKIIPEKVYWGESRMQSIVGAIQNLRAAYEARNVLIENRGALGILSNNSTDGIGATLPLNGDEKEELEKKLKEYGLSKKNKQIIVTSLNLKWQQMSIDANKLQLFEETREDFERICDAFGVPYELFAKSTGTTYANRKEARKEFYENTIIPEAKEWVDGLNRKIGADKLSYKIQASFDHLPIMQEDLKDKATAVRLMITALSQALQDGAITLEEYREELRKFDLVV